MRTFGVGAILTVLNLLAFGESVWQSCPQETEFECGLRPVEHPERDSKIYVGPAYPGQWPWHGIVYHRKPNQIVEYACGGTLISERHALTSTLCVKSENGTLLNSGDVLFRIGTHKQNVLNVGYAQHRQVVRIHQPVEYDEKSANKVVILELNYKVKFNKYVQPACLHEIQNLGSTHYDIVTGWGLPEGNDLLGNYGTIFKCENDHIYYTSYMHLTDVCDKDRSGVVHASYDFVLTDVSKYLYAIIDCVFACEKTYYNFPGIIKIYFYLPWIATITNLDYLRVIRKGQRYDPSKQYPNLLPRRNCGNVFNVNKKTGPNAQLYEYPWMAMIFSRNYLSGSIYHLCTGTLISHRYVLTAAMCSRWDDLLIVRLGDYDKRQNPDCTGSDEMDCAPLFQDYDVEYTIEHPDFNHSLRNAPIINDIALVRTKKTVLYEDHIQPVCLPVTPYLREKKFKQYMFTGWNFIEWYFKSKLNKYNVLQKTMESTVNLTECVSEERIHKKNNLSAIMCSKKYDFNYPGTPLGNIVNHNGKRFIQFALLSIQEIGPYFYTYIPYYMDWIVANMEE